MPTPTNDKRAVLKRRLSLLLRLLLAAAGIGYIAYSLTWTDKVVVTAGMNEIKPGILTMLRHADKGLLLLGLLLVAPIYPIQTVRWWMLMRCRGLDTTMWKSFRLLMVGCFFNYCMPGTTGGDVVKAYYAAKRSDRRAAAVMSVIFDRVTGLIGLLLVAAAASLFALNDPPARRVAGYIWLAVAAVVVGSTIYFSHKLREILGVNRLFELLPEEGLLSKMHEAAIAYGEHKGVVAATILISVPVHLLLIASTVCAAWALGMQSPVSLLVVVIPLLFLAGAVPLTYQGLGVMEGLGMAMLLPPAATHNQIVGTLLFVRVYQVVYSVLGSAFLLRGDIHMHPEIAPEPR